MEVMTKPLWAVSFIHIKVSYTVFISWTMLHTHTHTHTQC